MRLQAAVLLLSGAAIGCEILLLRVLSITQWHHFAYMVISLALLGYGAGGTLLALAGKRLATRFDTVFRFAAAVFALAAAASVPLSQAIPWNPLAAAWEGRQILMVSLLYGLLSVPFLCASVAIGLALTRFPQRIPLLYAADLLGAGLGAASALFLLYELDPVDCLLGFASAALLAGALAGTPGSPPRHLPRAAFLVAALALPWLWPAGWRDLQPSEYKGLTRALTLPGARVLERHSSPRGRLDLVESPLVPFRHAPGLSLLYDGNLPEQLGLFTDGDGLTVLNRAPDSSGLRHLDHLPTALPYHLLLGPRVLVLGAGGATEVQSALLHGARRVHAVEYDPLVADIVSRHLPRPADLAYGHPAVTLHLEEGRSFVARTRLRFDLIQLSLIDSQTAAAAGVQAISESYLYTLEAFDAYVDRLRPGGLLTITRWLKVPPRDALKLFATASEALRRRGGDPAGQLALLRGWNTTTLLVKPSPLTAADVAAIRRFADERGFDLGYLPGLVEGEANRHHVLARPYLFEGATGLLGDDARRFMERYKFRIEPATDDRPYFSHFFRWRTLPELLRLEGGAGRALLESGYLVLVATLVQAALAGSLLLALPLLAARRSARGGAPLGDRTPSRTRVSTHFFALGLAFLCLEIAFIQRFTLLLGDPVHAVGAVLAAFLVFAGLGSRAAERWRPDTGRWVPVGAAVSGIAVLGGLYVGAFPLLYPSLAGLGFGSRLAIAVGASAPLAFLMGMPFPTGLRRLGRWRPEWLPWAWAVNGCASVLGSVLASLLAVHFGVASLVGVALGLYVAAALVQPS